MGSETEIAVNITVNKMEDCVLYPEEQEEA